MSLAIVLTVALIFLIWPVIARKIRERNAAYILRNSKKYRFKNKLLIADSLFGEKSYDTEQLSNYLRKSDAEKILSQILQDLADNNVIPSSDLEIEIDDYDYFKNIVMSEIKKRGDIDIDRPVNTPQEHGEWLKDFIHGVDERAGTNISKDAKIERKEYDRDEYPKEEYPDLGETYLVLTINGEELRHLTGRASLPNLDKLNSILNDEKSDHYFFRYKYNNHYKSQTIFLAEKDYFENKIDVILEKI